MCFDTIMSECHFESGLFNLRRVPGDVSLGVIIIV